MAITFGLKTFHCFQKSRLLHQAQPNLIDFCCQRVIDVEMSIRFLLRPCSENFPSTWPYSLLEYQIILLHHDIDISPTPPKKKKTWKRSRNQEHSSYMNYCLRHRFFDYHLASHLWSKQTVLQLRGRLVLELKLFMMINLHWMQQSSTTLRLHSIPRDSPSINPRTKTSPELHFVIQNNKLLLQRQGFFQRVVSLCLQKASPVNKPR